MAQERISGRDSNAIKASLNLDSVFVLISEASIIIKNTNPVKKKGKGQYTFCLHELRLSTRENPSTQLVQLVPRP
jgi:hypothetical protein